MDLRNLSSTPNQLDSVMQRRPSLSSLSSTSGYASSTYGGAGNGNQPTNPTPQLSNQRLSSQTRNFSNGMSNQPPNDNSWLQPQSTNQSLSSSHPSNNGSIVNPPKQQVVANNVGPWVEQQKQQQQQSLGGIDTKHQQQQHQHQQQQQQQQPSNATSTMNVNSNINPNASMISTNADLDDVDDDHDDDDELIPTAIVIKNIPFAIKKEQLLDVMTKLSLPLPYAFNYHFDNGVFRGLAFANFTSTDETSLVVNQLNGREIGGRKLRVEYKKMLPLQERERIEREKREKRGQLEEQHRSTSTASLASLLSAASTTAATKNLSINGQQSSSQTERLFISFPFTNLNIGLPPSELNFNDPEVLELYSQLIIYRDDVSKSVFELAFPPNLHLAHRKILSILCSFLNLLELFDNGLIIVRRKPGQQSIQQRHQQNLGPLHSNSMMNLNQLSAIVSNQNQNLPNGNQNLPHPPELLRSQSQSALPLPRLRQQTSTPVQQQFPQYQQHQSQQQLQQSTGGPNQQLATLHASVQQPPTGRSYPQFGQYQQTGLPQSAPANQSSQSTTAPPPQLGTPTTSAAALLRSSNNRSFVDVRSTPPLANSFSQTSQSVNDSPTPQHPQQNTQHHPSSQQPPTQQTIHQHPFFSNNHSSSHLSQPSTPLGNNDLNSRFAPFGQHTHLTGSFTSLHPPSSSTTDEFPGGLNDTISSKFTGLNLGGHPFENPVGTGSSSNSGIWGPK
ncbi:hypothetical protein HYPBUDRAFT_122749 [Hyphopichia burtonii NRRL Y-1933]|uniref:RRM domain-containing protein n=1 Tax=Hyphopichia burtonii NRRL Y-1933 TaxID=984485 RepID=A0A1E4RKW1_9ASCO|nr:hypothetical protein HYPBUDRAFT_122749 [Hyphopichia burtonii NRRL Y-1933]ODV67841.1 hypothetical protein HYPBUDRAFT_122749 [Hyphopichia burtonii NRRL Y-1933]